MIDEQTAKRFISEMPWEEVPRPVLFMLPGAAGATRVHLHEPVSRGWKNTIALVGKTPEGVLGAALEQWVVEHCPEGPRREALLRSVRRLLN